MAYVASPAIVKRLRELAQEGCGDVRALASSRLVGSLLEGVNVDEARRRGLFSEKPVDIRPGGLKPHPQRLTDSGSVQLHILPVTFRITRTVAVGDQLTESDFDAIQAAALTDQDGLQQALSWPPNLSATEAGADTGIKGASSTGHTVRVTGTYGETMDITVEVNFELMVTSSPAAT